MPVLKNARHEKFAQARASGKSIDSAYKTAGYKENNSNACRLNGNEQVSARVAELQNKAAGETQVTAEEIIGGLRRVAELGLTPQEVCSAEGLPMYDRYELNAANKALELLGKTIGIFQEDAGDKPPMAVIVQYPVEKSK